MPPITKLGAAPQRTAAVEGTLGWPNASASPGQIARTIGTAKAADRAASAVARTQSES